jgi:aminoglycoside phosphotransferase (APT) family kinase protein
MNHSFTDIPGSEAWESITPIQRGWSDEAKYAIQTAAGARLLLRISSNTNFERKQQRFDCIRRIAATGITMPQPIAFGSCNADTQCYSLFTWVAGDDLEQRIHHFSVSQQYQLGVQAGCMLHTIHGVAAQPPEQSWEQRFGAKLDRNIQLQRNCPVQFTGYEHVIDYIQQHRHLLRNRPQSLQHGDYHIGSMVIDAQGRLGIIDFNRLDAGDPWEEFNRIPWCVAQSHYFASGIIHGYFQNNVPEEFFALLALYIGSNQLSSIPWAMQFGDEQIAIMQQQATQVLRWYDNFRTIVPSWYMSEEDVLLVIRNEK